MKLLVVANWKMNPQSLKEAKLLFNSVKKELKEHSAFFSSLREIKGVKKAEVIICPPFVYLPILKSFKGFVFGSQDCFWEEKGAYTGEVSPTMLKSLGCQYVIVGHSERRRHFQETDEMINKKIKAVLKAKLKPILCIDNISQLKNGLKGIETWKLKIKNLIIAYEPLFAIGTGIACSPERAKEMKNKIQKLLGKNIKVLYGGSVNSENAANYIKQAGFDGLLIGGASLNAKEFVKIIVGLDPACGV